MKIISQPRDGAIFLSGENTTAAAFFSHNVLRGELEQKGLVNAGGVLQTQAEGMFAAGRFTIPDARETERRALYGRLEGLARKCGKGEECLREFQEAYAKDPGEGKKMAEKMIGGKTSNVLV